MSDHNDIYSIVERLRILEEGLDKNQKSVDQLSATFKPKTVAVLTAKKDPKNPMAGKLVGGCEESVNNEVAEDVLDKVKKSFADYLKNVADEITTDSDLKDKKKDDSDIKKKDKQDRDLISKVDEDPAAAVAGEIDAVAADTGGETGSGPQIPAAEVSTPTINPTMPESAPVKTVELTDGVICEIHGDEHQGFEIRRGNRSMPSRFKDLSQAEMALELFKHRLNKNNEAQDYVDEA